MPVTCQLTKTRFFSVFGWGQLEARLFRSHSSGKTPAIGAAFTDRIITTGVLGNYPVQYARKGHRFQLLFQRWHDRGIDEEKILYDSDNTNDINNVFLWNMTVFVHNISLVNIDHNDTAK